MSPTPCTLRLGSSFEEVTNVLSLDPTDAEDVRIYHIMLVPNINVTDVHHQREVEQGRQRLIQNKDALLPQFKNSTTIRPPYQRTQIDFRAFLQEARAIHLTACTETRVRYDLVAPASAPDSSNAAINWLLWQTLRRGEQSV